MALGTDVVARRYEDVVAATPIAVDIPTFEASDITVYYGNETLVAVQNTDYDIALAGDFNTITITPLASLITKIDALIAADPTEENAITVRRALDLLTEATAAGVRYTPFTAREFERAAMRDQQLSDLAARSIRLGDGFADPYTDLSIQTIPSDVSDAPALVFLATGGLGPGPSSSQIAYAQGFALAAAASAELAEVGFPFEDVAAFEAATIPATLMAWSITITGQRVDFARDATSTSPITSANGVKGSPVGDGMPQHFGAVADGVADDAPAFLLLIAWLATSNSQRVKLRGVYFTEAPIVWSSFGLYVDTGGLSSTKILANHVAGPAMQFRKSRCMMSRIQILATATRLAGTYGVPNGGVILGDFDWTNPTNAPTTSGTNTIISQCSIEEHNGCGIYAVSANNIIDGNSILDNLGHGIWIDSGQALGIGATSQSGWGRVAHNNCKRNGGHAVAVGDPTVAGAEVVYRMETDNNDCADNSTNAAICHGHQKQISLIGQGLRSAQNATKGDNGGMFVAGKDHKHVLNRFVGSTGECYEIGDYVTFPTGGIEIDEMSVVTPASGDVNPAIVIASTITASDAVTVKQGRSANITNLVAIADRAKYARIVYQGAYDYGGGLFVSGEQVVVDGALQTFLPTVDFATPATLTGTDYNTQIGEVRRLSDNMAELYVELDVDLVYTGGGGTMNIAMFAALSGFAFDSTRPQGLTLTDCDKVIITSGKFLTCRTNGTSSLRLTIIKTDNNSADVDVDDMPTGFTYRMTMNGIVRLA